MGKVTKTQLADKIKQAENILVITDSSPDLDCLTGGLGLYNVLREWDKNIIFVHRDKCPPELDFLDAGEAFQEDAEPLRDFIISFGREKVDKFRYSLNEETERYDVLLTPAHRQVITEEDIKYQTGDFNVDLIIGLNIRSLNDIDETISQHSQLVGIDAPVVNILAGEKESTWRTDTWQVSDVSSISEMIYGLCRSLEGLSIAKSLEAAQDDKQNIISKIDITTANAFLTGIVYTTERFKNKQTLPQTMYASGELLKLGADSLLVSENLNNNYSTLEETQEMLEEALDGNIKDLSTARHEQEKARFKKRMRRTYVSQGDIQKAAAIEGAKKEEKKAIAIDRINIDNEGNLRVLDEEQTPPAENPSALPDFQGNPPVLNINQPGDFSQSTAPNLHSLPNQNLGVSPQPDINAYPQTVIPPNEGGMPTPPVTPPQPIANDQSLQPNMNLSSPRIVNPTDYVNALSSSPSYEQPGQAPLPPIGGDLANTLDTYLAQNHNSPLVPPPQSLIDNTQPPANPAPSIPQSVINNMPSQNQGPPIHHAPPLPQAP